MAKYLKLFETDADYQQFIGGDFLKPNSLVTDTNSLFYNPLEKELPYLTITALEDDLTVLFSNSSQYSLNGTDWNELSANTITPAISSGEKIYIKAEGLTPNSRNGIGTFTVSNRFNLSGNVMSMLFGDEAEGKTDLTGYDGCFNTMFGSCTGLEQVSKNFLPATTLADGCYANMFAACTSLVNAPELPATTLAEWCYNNMFGGCTSLNYIKMLATDISANNCLSGWIIEVPSTGIFVKSKDATWNPENHRGVNGIPEGWIVETV